MTPEEQQRLEALPTLKSLDLVPGVEEVNDGGNFRASEKNFHHATHSSYGVLADVREGGLKRDLSTLLERPIDITETDDQFMLYRFDEDGEARVPIQDLAAYYQLHDDDPNWTRGRRGGVKYTSNSLANSLQVNHSGHGTPSTRERYLRQYASLYTNPVPVKVQFLLAFGATPITPEDNEYWDSRGWSRRDTDTHKLLLGVIPVVTLWNPNNTPLVMNANANTSQVFRMSTPPFALELRKYRADGTIYNNGTFNINHANGSNDHDGRAGRLFPHVMQLRFANTTPIVFEPGEVKIFSFPSSAGGSLSENGNALRVASRGDANLYEPINEWDPFGFFVTFHGSRWLRNPSTNPAVPNDALRVVDSETGSNRGYLLFGPNDHITTQIYTESTATAGQQVARMNETRGGAFNFYLMDYSHGRWNSGTMHFRNYQFISRFGGPTRLGEAGGNEAFNAELMAAGFPGGNFTIPFEPRDEAIPGIQLINAAAGSGEAIAFLEFSMAAGCEVSSSSAGGFAGGRRITTRPFHHGSIIASTFVDDSDAASRYDYGWDWQAGKINNVEDSIIQGDPGTGRGFYGGGYTIEAGATHVVQQEIPVLPPISIASLSSAHLGGFSLANAASVANPDSGVNGTNSSLINEPEIPGDFHRVTATGQGGLAPHIMQAIGNSYAHPNIPADKAFITKTRLFNLREGSLDVPYVDHAYLANKALWDEYFFSSITPQPARVQLYERADRDARAVAGNFFLDGEPLPNRRMVPYGTEIDRERLDELFAQKDLIRDGMADKIAAHLMVEGPFNINSTSVDAWRTLFSSLRGKPVAYLENGRVNSTTTDGTAVGPGALANSEPINTAAITRPNNPPEQWKAARELTDAEIDELAEAMVHQVRLRGPFLSLSEFVNRRLDAGNEELAVKGALQAAIDDPSVSINAAFRTAARMLDAESTGIDFAFPAAANGPIAYGSAPYVDQADILRNLAGQLTPRGDTYVIRTYGDSIDAAGKVVARAWCEAIVQRIPEYVDPSADEPHIRQADLQSPSNRNFGRRFQIVSFRWLNPDEV
jgi:hypothetical protein